MPLQTTQQSLEVAQEACNDLDMRATQAEAERAALQDELAGEREQLGTQVAQVSAGAWSAAWVFCRYLCSAGSPTCLRQWWRAHLEHI